MAFFIGLFFFALFVAIIVAIALAIGSCRDAYLEAEQRQIQYEYDKEIEDLLYREEVLNALQRRPRTTVNVDARSKQLHLHEHQHS